MSAGAPRTLFWDFDGTLARRLWSETFFDVYRAFDPTTTVDAPMFRSYSLQGFPWHAPETAFPKLATADEWWERLWPVFTGAFRGVGCAPEIAGSLAQQVRAHYLDHTRWTVFDDAADALAEGARRFDRQIIVSNHAPELADLMANLGLDRHIYAVVSSAWVGYEKPHPNIYAAALEQAGNPSPADVWMVGDNPVADVLGAEACGMRGVLVRRTDPRVSRQANTLLGALEIIEKETAGENGA